jgi:SAM-dependent methyltransferase
MPGVSFDRAADYYDQTRGYGAGAADGIRDAIVAYTGAGVGARFLELGVGTGRIALPFIRAGYDYTGVDISRPMMERLTAKLAADAAAASYHYELREADVAALPFADASFDVVITVHVLHLVADWQATLREAHRVLRPGGWLLIGHDSDTTRQPQPTASEPARVRDRWLEIRGELGFDKPAGRSNIWGGDERLIAFLQSLGARTAVVSLAEIERPAVTAREMLERYRARMYSADWETPDAIHGEAIRRLEEWMRREIADADTPYASQGQFTAITATWADEILQ